MNGAPDPQRLEDGLRQLQELGYLRTPASAYVARRVAGRRSITRAVLASSLWIGAGTGLGFALLMAASAAISNPQLIGAPRSLLILFFQLALVLTLIFAVVTGAFSAAVLLLHRGGSSIRGSASERALVLVPGLLATVYLVDRVGRALLEGADTGMWGTEAALLVIFAAFFATGLSGAMRGALAMVRLQLHGVWSPPKIGGVERALPAIVGAVLSIGLLALGPYGPGERLPWFDEVEVQPVQSVPPLVVVGIDGLPAGSAPEGAHEGVAMPDRAASPTAYWNEIATGFVAREHGLVSTSTSAPRGWSSGGERLREDPVVGTLVDRLMPGLGLTEQQAADRRELRRPPLWEIAARGGQRVRVINWWGSYPAVSAPGLEIISERQWLRHSAGAELDSFLAAPPYLAMSDAEFTLRRSGIEARLASFTALLDELEAPAAVRDLFFLAASADAYHLECAAQALRDGSDFVAVLLSGPDILLRAGWGIEGWSEDDGRRLREGYFGALLGTLGRALGPAGDGDAWVLGVERDAEGLVSGTWGRGPWPVRPAAAAAVILDRLGVPAAADMAGAGPGGPATYGLLRPGVGPQNRAAPDLEQLRTLGYIGD